MQISIISNPPLGDTTFSTEQEPIITFTVLLQATTLTKDWEVELWHNFEAQQWKSSSLQLTSQNASPPFFNSNVQEQSPLKFAWYTAQLPVALQSSDLVSTLSFTIRFRTSASDLQWKWANDQPGCSDGHISLRRPFSSASREISHYLSGLGDDLHAIPANSDTPNTILWGIEGTASACKEHESTFTRLKLGRAQDFKRWFAIVRDEPQWLAPRHGTSSSGELADKAGIMYAFERDDGSHLVLLAISGISMVECVFEAEDGQLVLCARSDCETDTTARAAAAVGHSFDEALAATVYFARKLIIGHIADPTELRMAIRGAHSGQTTREREEAHAEEDWLGEEWYDGLTYCTWNSVGRDLSEEKILKALEELHNHGVKPSRLLIDDNWQSLDNLDQPSHAQRWTKFEANSRGFPQGLAHTVSLIRLNYPHIKDIGVWHALLGYWNNIASSSPLSRDYPTDIVPILPRHTLVNETNIIDPYSAKALYNDFYRFLFSSGITFTKTDVQCNVDALISPKDRVTARQEYATAWRDAYRTHLHGRSISCMSQIPSLIFGHQLPNTAAQGPEIPIRNSCDFYPDVPEAHPWHLFCNAYNSLFTKYLNGIPDWDMFQTRTSQSRATDVDPWPVMHAAARALAGSPLMITDTLGQHNTAVINALTAISPYIGSFGARITLRPSVTGHGLDPYTSFDSRNILKIGSYHGNASTGVSFLGLFNITNHPILSLTSLLMFPGVTGPNKYFLHNYISGGISFPFLASRAFFAARTPPHHFMILSAHLAIEVSGIQVANLGLTSQFTGPVATIRSSIAAHPTPAQANTYSSSSSTHSQPPAAQERAVKTVGINIKATLKALGTWSIALSPPDNTIQPRDWITIDNSLVTLKDQVVPRECVSLFDLRFLASHYSNNMTQISSSESKVGEGEEEGDGVGEMTNQGSVEIRVDLERAWEIMGFEKGMERVVEVGCFVRMDVHSSSSSSSLKTSGPTQP